MKLEINRYIYIYMYIYIYIFTLQDLWQALDMLWPCHSNTVFSG